MAAAWAVSAGAASVGCGPAGAGAPLPPPPGEVVVTMVGLRFDHPPVATPGRTVFRTANTDTVEHALTLVRLPPDVTGPAAELVASGTRRTFPTTARVFPRPPGSAGLFAVDLEPGRYAMFCFVVDPDGRRHADLGMVSDLAVQG